MLALHTRAAEREAQAQVPLPCGRSMPLDVICLSGGVIGLVLLAVVRPPGPAIAVTVATDLIAYIPTVVHAWRRPREEIAGTFVLYSAGAALTLTAAAQTGDLRVFAAVAYPANLLAADMAGVCVIFARRWTSTADRGLTLPARLTALARPENEVALHPSPAAGEPWLRRAFRKFGGAGAGDAVPGSRESLVPGLTAMRRPQGRFMVRPRRPSAAPGDAQKPASTAADLPHRASHQDERYPLGEFPDLPLHERRTTLYVKHTLRN